MKRPAARAEVLTWVVAVVTVNVFLVFTAFGRSVDPGIGGLRGMPADRYALLAATALVVGAGLGLVTFGLRTQRHTIDVISALVAAPVFLTFQTTRLNTDGLFLAPRIEHAVPLLGAYLTHDELLEFFVHSRIWYYTHRWFGWSVVHAYQVVSCLAGSVFVYAVLRLTRRIAPSWPLLFVAGVLGGGYMQLFFGDAENYTLTAVMVVFYLLASMRFLAGAGGLWQPAAVLGAAVCFHLEAACLVPSLCYLMRKSWRRHGDAREAARAAIVTAAVVAGTFVYFNFHGLPLIRFFSSHAGNALRTTRLFSIGAPRSYFAQQLRLLLLLSPAVVMLPPLVAWHWRERDESSEFLMLSAAFFLLLQAVWKSQIGVYEDWNLYSAGALVTAVLIWREIATAARTVPMRVVAGSLAGTAWLQTYAWIVANHRPV